MSILCIGLVGHTLASIPISSRGSLEHVGLVNLAISTLVEIILALIDTAALVKFVGAQQTSLP